MCHPDHVYALTSLIVSVSLGTGLSTRKLRYLGPRVRDQDNPIIIPTPQSPYYSTWRCEQRTLGSPEEVNHVTKTMILYTVTQSVTRAK